MRVKQGLKYGFAVIMMGSALMSRAQDGNEVLVTAGRGLRSSDEVAANVTVIDRDKIEAGHNQSVVDVLRNVEGVLVKGVADNPAMAEVNLRGFSENGHGRVLVMLDGRRLNWPSMSNINWLEIPLSNVERIEIVRGGGSVLYGDHAVAGVINIITRAQVSEKPFEVKVSGGSYGLLSGSASYSARYDDLQLGLNVSHLEQDGYRDRSAFESTGYGVNMGYDLHESSSLSLSALIQSDEYEIPGYLSRDQMESDPRQSISPDDSAENDFFNVHADYVLEPTEGHEFRLDLSFSRRETISDMTSWFSFSDTTLDSLALMPKYVIGAGPGENGNRFTAGVDFYLDEMDVDRFDDKARTMAGISADVKKESVGGYIHDEFVIENGFVVSAGLRAEQNKISAEVGRGGVLDVDDTKDHDAVAYEFALLKKLGGGSKVYVSYGSVYRYPFVDEQVSYYGYGADSFYADIEPEEGWNLEAGIDHVISGGLSGGLTLFVLNMEDEISYNPVTSRNENLDETTRMGAEMNLAYDPGNGLSIAANYTYINAEFTKGVDDGKEIPLVPEHKGSIAVEGDLPAGFSARTVLSYVSERWLGGDRSNSSEQLDDYTTVDLYITKVFAGVEGLELYLGVENLFDEEYAELAYIGYMEDGYYPAAGTVYKGGAVYRF